MAKVSSRRDKGNKKLSWIYRMKKRSEKFKPSTDNISNDANNVDAQNKKGRIIVRNLSFQVQEEDLRKLYEPFGDIREINLPKRADGKLIGCGFVQFNNVKDASKAIFNTNKKEFLGRVISSDWAIPKSKFCQKIDNAATVENTENEEDHKQEDHKTSDSLNKEKSNAFKQKNRKIQKLKKRKKRARIIIRNLSFEATEDAVKEYFSQYGDIEEVEILKKEDGTYVGCGFVQFELVQSAAKAIHYANMQPFLDRPIVVDWAVPKNKFCDNIKKEPVDEQDIKVEIKEEPLDDYENNTESIMENSINEENTTINSTGNQESNNDYIKLDTESNREQVVKSNKNNREDENESNSDSNEEDQDEDIEDEEDENDEDSEDKDVKPYKVNKWDEKEDEEMNQRPKRISNDVTEGKTVFLKNVPFSVKSNDLKMYMEEHFGPVYYALVCVDHLTEHSKGTAFVKFKNVEDAERCLSGDVELRLHDDVMEAHRALKRNEVENKKSLREQRNKDSRNLYLIKEGVIAAGSPAATGVSVTDMSKRLQLEQWKSQMLRNLNMFISRVRLVVHNLPPNLDDNKLRQIFKKHGGNKAVIREARVMRDMKNVDANGIGKSKEYGFVTFTSHEDALRALRSINNNPNIFSAHRRPIVGFSIENRIMVNAKERRIRKSREHNPLWSGNKEKNMGKRKSEDTGNKSAKRSKVEKTEESDKKSFVGLTGKPGATEMRSKYNLKTQALLHNKTVRNENKKAKLALKEKSDRQRKKQQTVKNNPSSNKKKFDSEDANFNNLVESYKKKLLAVGQTKSKWYETA